MDLDLLGECKALRFNTYKGIYEKENPASKEKAIEFLLI